MRITNGMVNRNFNYHLQNNLSNMNKIDEKLSTGKEVNKISDDPSKSSKIMRMKNDIAKNVQYRKNIIDATNYLDVTDKSLEQINGGLQKIRELLVNAGNATYGSEERSALKQEISQTISKIGDVVNTTFDGKYIFGGERINHKPIRCGKDDGSENLKLLYGIDEGQADYDQEFNKINKTLKMEISSGVMSDYGINAVDIMQFKHKENDVNLMDVFSSILENLDSDDRESYNELITKNLEDIDAGLKNISDLRGNVGARQNRMEDALELNDEEKFNIKEILSSLEDIDFAEKTIDYVTASTMYNASLQASSKIMQPSLIDYLR